MREVKRQEEKGKRAGDELRKRTPVQFVKICAIRAICAIRVSNPCPSVSIRGLNPVFKIKNRSPNAKKLLKVNKGQLRPCDTPPGGPFLSGIFIGL